MEIDRISNVTYGDLQNHYMSRDLPVIVSDSHDVWPNRNDVPADFIEFLLTLPKLRHTVPCNTVTNLLQMRNGVPNLHRLLKQARNLESEDWFLHFRNCEFEGVKASRRIFPSKHRPYFVSTHLPPFHSSWILLINQFGMGFDKQIPVKDLVLVSQLSGQISGRLAIHTECIDFCANLEFQLNAGETLLFNAEMWKFFYHNTKMMEPTVKSTITFIQEIQIN